MVENFSLRELAAIDALDCRGDLRTLPNQQTCIDCPLQNTLYILLERIAHEFAHRHPEILDNLVSKEAAVDMSAMIGLISKFNDEYPEIDGRHLLMKKRHEEFTCRSEKPSPKLWDGIQASPCR